MHVIVLVDETREENGENGKCRYVSLVKPG